MIKRVMSKEQREKRRLQILSLLVAFSSYIVALCSSLFLSGCIRTNLDVSVKQWIDESCDCDFDSCICHDVYNKENVVVVNCTDIKVSSISDIIRYCDYYNVIDGYKWSKNNQT